MDTFELCELLSEHLEKQSISHSWTCFQQRVFVNMPGDEKDPLPSDLRSKVASAVSSWLDSWVSSEVASKLTREVSSELSGEPANAVAREPRFIKLMGKFGDYRLMVNLKALKREERGLLLKYKARQILMAALASHQIFLSERAVMLLAWGELREALSYNHARKILGLLETNGVIIRNGHIHTAGREIDRRKATNFLAS